MNTDLEGSEEEAVVSELFGKGLDKPAIFEICRDPSLSLDMRFVEESYSRLENSRFLPSYTDSNGAWIFLHSVFARAGNTKKGSYNTPGQEFEALSQSGAKLFKRKALGLCGFSSVKSLEELANLFVETKITNSYDEALDLIPRVVQANELHSHGISFGMLKYMSIKRVNGDSKEVKYKISAWGAD